MVKDSTTTRAAGLDFTLIGDSLMNVIKASALGHQATLEKAIKLHFSIVSAEGLTLASESVEAALQAKQRADDAEKDVLR